MIISCDKINREHKVNKEELLSSDYRIFQDTPAWELAKAVWDEDIDEIKKEVKKKSYNNKLPRYYIWKNYFTFKYI